MQRFEKLLSIAMLIFAIGFNLWLYRLEPSAKIDPNDNTFQYALVDRTNQVWDFAAQKCFWNLFCRLSYLTDHWVPNWAEGYNLPYYYSHLPQIVIVASYRFFFWFMNLFTYYHWVIYFLLGFFPLSVFVALRVIGLSWSTAGIGSLLATQISTDGLYGLDPPSFLWRGYGLSSQLFAMVFLPLALAYAYRWFSTDQSKPFWRAVFFLFGATAGHLGIGMIAILSLLVLAVSQPLRLLLEQQPVSEIAASLKINLGKLLLLSLVVLFFLSYWLIPIFLTDNYHNISFWDPVWKFNSYGAKEITIRLLNGDLFDFGRFPVFTLLIFIGFFVALKKHAAYFPFPLLFLFWLFLYFGRTTWDSLIDLIPGMKEFHLSRFIVGLHLAGLFLAPIGLAWLVETASEKISQVFRKNYSLIHLVTYSLICLLFLIPIYQQTFRYNELNNQLIVQANTNFDKLKPDLETLFTTLRQLPPGRIFAGRGGTWGKNFRIAETPYYMYLSTYGFPTVLWLPETWSPNSDIEQYFREDQASDYDLFNITYVVAPPGQSAQPFWKLIKDNPSWKLYQVKTAGYVTAGVRPAIVATNKRSYVNLVHQFVQSDYPAKGIYPQLTFSRGFPKKEGLPNLRLIDEVTYQMPDGSLHNLFHETPLYVAPGGTNQVKPKILSQSETSEMVFQATVSVADSCRECLIILKQSAHPNWRVTIDGQAATAITVFPFYLAVPISEGTHRLVFSYEPARLKVILLALELAALGILLGKKALDKSTKTLHS